MNTLFHKLLSGISPNWCIWGNNELEDQMSRLQLDKLEMLVHLRWFQCDGCHCQVDDDFGGWVKTTVIFLVIGGPKVMKFWNFVGTLSSFQCYFPTVYIGDISPQSCHWVAKSSKI